MPSQPHNPDEDERSIARERVLTLMYEADSKGVNLSDVVNGQVVPLDSLAEELVAGIGDRYVECDELIVEFSRAWSLERMPMMDRNILRLGIFELKHRLDTPVAVVIDEAIELAKRFSTDESGRFVNGILSAIAKRVRV